MRAKVLWSMMLAYVCLTGCEEQVAERKPPSGADFADMRKGSSGPGIPGASAPTSRGVAAVVVAAAEAEGCLVAVAVVVVAVAVAVA
jgi:hypothetical protein